MPGSPRSAFTLLETLLALAIAFVVVGLVYSVLHSVQSTVELQQSLASGPERAVNAMAQISDDLARAFVGPADPETRFRLEREPGSPNRAKLQFCTLRADLMEQDLRWADAVLVGIETDTSPDGMTLMQIERPLDGPGSQGEPTTNRLVEAVSGWEVEVFDSENWVNEWPPAGNQDLLPSAVRLRLRREAGEVWETEVLIGTQQVTQPSAIRGSGAVR